MVTLAMFLGGQETSKGAWCCSFRGFGLGLERDTGRGQGWGGDGAHLLGQGRDIFS